VPASAAVSPLVEASLIDAPVPAAVPESVPAPAANVQTPEIPQLTPEGDSFAFPSLQQNFESVATVKASAPAPTETAPSRPDAPRLPRTLLPSLLGLDLVPRESRRESTETPDDMLDTLPEHAPTPAEPSLKQE
jgi:hypothetical protein